MADRMTARTDTNPWIRLLEETHLALAHLRSEDLEELCVRAECMLHATAGEALVRQPLPAPDEGGGRDVSREQRLLGDLLLATRTNLEILQRTSGQAGLRWVL